MKPTDAFPDMDAFYGRLRTLVQAVSEMTFPATRDDTLAARNVMYHADKLLIWLDVFYGRVELDVDGELPAYDDPLFLLPPASDE